MVKCTKCQASGKLGDRECHVCRGSCKLKREFLVLGQALCSPHADLPTIVGENSTTRSSVSGLSGELEDYITAVIDGGYVVDKRNVPIDVLTRWVVSGPMMRDDLPAGHCSPPFGKDPSPMTVEELIGRFDGISMTYISIDLYVELWKRLGAKVFRVRRGKAKEI